MNRSILIFTLLAIITGCASQQSTYEDRIEKNKAIVRGYMEEIVNKGNWDQWGTYFTEKMVFDGLEITKEGFKNMIDSFFRSRFPDFYLTIEEQIAERDRVVTRVTFRGTHLGEFEGIAPTSKKVEFWGIAIDRIADGKVVEMWHQVDKWGMLQQLRSE